MPLSETEIQLFSFVSNCLGWIYVASWGIALYPQIIKNYRSKSVIGLSFDFLVYNAFGHILYFIYNSNLFWNYNKMFLEEAARKVKVNDVAYSAHAVTLCCILVIQCVVYKRGEQRVSNTCVIGVSLTLLAIIVEMYMARWQLYGVTWQHFIDTLASVKVISSAVKFLPQVLMIYHGKTARGISLATIVCDFIGGLGSVSQSILDMHVDHNGDSLVPIAQSLLLKRFSPKLTLGCVCIFFNSVFFYQKYIYSDHFKEDYDVESGTQKADKTVKNADASSGRKNMDASEETISISVANVKQIESIVKRGASGEPNIRVTENSSDVEKN